MRAEGVPETAWRKGTQWCALTREHAALFVADQWVFDVFDRRGPGAGAPRSHCAPAT